MFNLYLIFFKIREIFVKKSSKLENGLKLLGLEINEYGSSYYILLQCCSSQFFNKSEIVPTSFLNHSLTLTNFFWCPYNFTNFFVAKEMV